MLLPRFRRRSQRVAVNSGTLTLVYNMLPNDALQLIAFDSTWTGLDSISISTRVQIDNIALDTRTATPEPGPIALLVGGGIAGAGAAAPATTSDTQITVCVTLLLKCYL